MSFELVEHQRRMELIEVEHHLRIAFAEAEHRRRMALIEAEHAGSDEALRALAESITPSNDHLRSMVGTFSAAPDAFDEEEMPY